MDDEINTELDVVKVDSRENLPNLCYSCGAMALSAKTVEIAERHSEWVEDTSPLASRFLSIVSLIFLPLPIFVSQSGTRHFKLSFKLQLPTCTACTEKQPNILNHCVRMNTINLVAHTRFINALEHLRGESRS